MRLRSGGLIDRDTLLELRFDGVPIEAHPGDTLASALIGAGVRVVARSFKYHRPRGIVTAGSEEPNALVTLGRGDAAEPNLKATTIEARDGLEARSQNAWPSVNYDLMAVNGLLAPFIGAGFYYKTFMWPRRFWERLYEPVIRRAAGLGRLEGGPHPERCEKAFAHCDLLVIGAGPAGLMAALTAGRAGADVILADEDMRPGGRLLAEREEVGGQPGATWAETIAAELRAMPNVRLMTRTAVTGAYDHGTYAMLERLPEGTPGLPRACFWRVSSRAAILASGAAERMPAFPGNDRPGVMTAGALRAYVNRWAVSPAQSVAIFAASDDGHRTAADLQAAGLHVAGVIDPRPDAPRLGRYPLFAGAEICGTSGRGGLEAVSIRHPRGTVTRLAAGALAVSGGWSPQVQLSCHMNGRPVWRDDLQAFVPAPGAVPGQIPAGAAAGEMGTAECLRSGRDAARQALSSLGITAPEIPLPGAEGAPAGAMPIWFTEGRGPAFADLQNDVTVKDIRQAAAENFTASEHMKRYTTQGMATDQGRTGGITALAVLAAATGRSIAAAGTTTFRPPYVPVPIAAWGAGGQHQGFAPRRLSTAHRAMEAMGAPMIAAGLWFRPSYFPAPGESTWRQSCDREAAMVRETVGIADVSTLGKIAVQGPDAAEFLDFVYANPMSSLQPGRVRYGLMLREDGFVMDDGTCARLGPDDFLVTTTTAAAGQVMQHMEFVHQCLRPGMRVRLASQTEHWAQFAIAGPRARDLLDGLLDGAAPGDLPFMAWTGVTLMGVTGRLFRISFSGELGYELAVPAAAGDSLFRLLVARAGALGGGAYGMEAMSVLRVEKGFATHAEMDGRITAGDLGLGRMLKPGRDFIGAQMARREALSDPARPALVGLRAVGAVKQLTAGSFLFEPGDDARRGNEIGRISSVAFSPALGEMIALGFVAGGAARHGTHVQMTDHLRGLKTLCEVCPPVFVDPEGERMRG